jgi:hypothetical protein
VAGNNPTSGQASGGTATPLEHSQIVIGSPLRAFTAHHRRQTDHQQQSAGYNLMPPPNTELCPIPDLLHLNVAAGSPLIKLITTPPKASRQAVSLRWKGFASPTHHVRYAGVVAADEKFRAKSWYQRDRPQILIN